MARSKLFSLNTRDFLKGLFISIITAVLTVLYSGIQDGEIDWKLTATTAILTAISYIIKNLAEDEKGEVPFIPTQKNQGDEESK
ncbi:MAG: hypothetical protein J5588_06325 [Bacteroidales bacterium]|nr:hypothetical protein [Bacteroidales bacterium]MBP5372430.1 hypothetical protein [Bacteroidales bacterium]